MTLTGQFSCVLNYHRTYLHDTSLENVEKIQEFAHVFTVAVRCDFRFGQLQDYESHGMSQITRSSVVIKEK